MGADTAIAWTDHSFNPWIGCARVSPACTNCYAEALDKRVGGYRSKGDPAVVNWGKTAPRHVTSDDNWREPVRWNRAAAKAGRPSLVFCASMSDVFEDRDDLMDARERLFELVQSTPYLIWQLLTKRPENVLDMVPGWWHDDFEAGQVGRDEGSSWPSNVWIGTTVEDQQRADERLPSLFGIPAVVRFVSFEPLLGNVILDRWLIGRHGFYRGVPRLQWGIVGGESGPKHRPLNLDHAQDLIGQLQQAAVPTFFKQVGGLHPKSGGDMLNGRRYHEFPQEAQR